MPIVLLQLYSNSGIVGFTHIYTFLVLCELSSALGLLASSWGNHWQQHCIFDASSFHKLARFNAEPKAHWIGPCQAAASCRTHGAAMLQGHPVPCPALH